MKKMLALLLALTLLSACAAALGETATAAPTADTTDWVTVQLPDIGMEFQRPADLTPAELTDEDYNNGFAYIAGNDKLSLQIYLFEQDDNTTLDSVEAELAANPDYKTQQMTVNDISTLYFQTTKDGKLCDGVLLMGTDGMVYQFMFFTDPADTETQYLAGQIMNTLHATETAAQ